MDNKYIWPVMPKYKIAEHDKYGIRENHYVLFKKRQHSGFDITADIGTKVCAIYDGIVDKAEFDGTTTEGFDAFNDGYGNKIEIINNDGKRIIYAHLSEFLVKKGDVVNQGDIIAKTGCSGGSRVPHLHLEIRKSDTELTGLDNTINPLDILPKIEWGNICEDFTTKPYSDLWKILISDSPWSFSKQDIPYSEDSKYIR